VQLVISLLLLVSEALDVVELFYERCGYGIGEIETPGLLKAFALNVRAGFRAIIQ
jgi:hypothetical protein